MTTIRYNDLAQKWEVQIAGEVTRWYDTEVEAIMSIEAPEHETLRWQKLSLAQIAQGASLIDGLAPNQRLRPMVQPLIDAAAPGAIVEGGSWTKEQAQEVAALWAALEVFLATPITVDGPTPLEIVSRYA